MKTTEVKTEWSDWSPDMWRKSLCALCLVAAPLAALGQTPAGSWPDYRFQTVAEIDESGVDPRKSAKAIDAGALAVNRAHGLITCYVPAKTKKGVREEPYFFDHSATLVLNGFIVITDLHAFMGTPADGEEYGYLLTARSNCRFRVMSSAGEEIEGATIKNMYRTEAITRPTLDQISGQNETNDWAILELASEITKAEPISIAPRDFKLAVNDRLELCSFSSDLNDLPKGDFIERCVQGSYRLNGRDTEYRHSGLILYDMSTAQRSSGAGVTSDRFDPPVLVAVHTGGVCDTVDKAFLYRMTGPRCFNHGILLSEDMREVLAQVLSDTGGLKKRR